MILNGYVCYLQKEANFVKQIEKLSNEKNIPLISVDKKSNKLEIAKKYY